jgi:hypothetical protein
MAGDWAADVKKYVPDADDGIIAGVVRYCGISLQKRDSALVSFGDPAETKRVRENFLKKKLALTQSDDKLDAAIAEVGVRMKSDKTRNRVTVYYRPRHLQLHPQKRPKRPLPKKLRARPRPSLDRHPQPGLQNQVRAVPLRNQPNLPWLKLRLQKFLVPKHPLRKSLLLKLPPKPKSQK